MDERIQKLRTNFFGTFQTLHKKEIENIVEYLSQKYYNEGISLLTDEEFDRLKELYVRKFGDTSIMNNVGAKVEKGKVTLPFFMGSMDKMKPENHNLESWKSKNPGQVCISDKLDGISALFQKKDGKVFLYTRGDGTIGQDISHMIPYIQIGDFPSIQTYVVRGELIVNKANYNMVKEGKKGARQMVAGLANQKKITADRVKLLKYVEFVAYEVIIPESLKPSEQFRLLDSKSTFQTVWWKISTEISIPLLSELLAKRKEESNYEIDGSIIAHDAVYPRRVGKNPEHAFAFKMAFADQAAITEVVGVNWEASKNGFLKPTVHFEPVHIGGSTIQYATGFHASFIHQHGVGPGAFVEIVRSGDVIPHIREVKSAAPSGPAMPSVPWHWNETHTDAILNTIEGNPDVQKRVMLFFAQTMEIAYCGEGTVAKLYEAGIHTIPQLLQVTEEFLLKNVAGFGKASASKLVQSIQEAKKKATVAQWAVGSGIFGRGVGSKRLEAALRLSDPTVKDVAGLPSWSLESAEEFIRHLPEFNAFLEEIGAVPKKVPSPVVRKGKFLNVGILFTGFHPKDLEEAVQAQGAYLADAFNKKVTMLVVKDETVSNEKTKKAAANGILIVTAEQLRAMLQ